MPFFAFFHFTSFCLFFLDSHSTSVSFASSIWRWGECVREVGVKEVLNIRYFFFVCCSSRVTYLLFFFVFFDLQFSRTQIVFEVFSRIRIFPPWPQNSQTRTRPRTDKLWYSWDCGTNRLLVESSTSFFANLEIIVG